MQDLKQRTKTFSLDVYRLCEKIPKSRELDALVRQLIRCSTSVGANYRAANRAKSDRDFINKLKIVEEEADESMFWMELLSEIVPQFETQLAILLREANELLAITVASINTVRKRINKT